MAKCLNCGDEYEAKRSTSAYCSSKCKQEFYRNRMKGVKVTLVTADETKSVTVTDRPKTRTIVDVDIQAAQDGMDKMGFERCKRGADIQTFADLPPDVQRTIETMSQHADNPSEDKTRRTIRAIHYQHLFSNRY